MEHYGLYDGYFSRQAFVVFTGSGDYRLRKLRTLH